MRESTKGFQRNSLTNALMRPQLSGVGSGPPKGQLSLTSPEQPFADDVNQNQAIDFAQSPSKAAGYLGRPGTKTTRNSFGRHNMFGQGGRGSGKMNESVDFSLAKQASLNPIPED